MYGALLLTLTCNPVTPAAAPCAARVAMHPEGNHRHPSGEPRYASVSSMADGQLVEHSPLASSRSECYVGEFLTQCLLAVFQP